MVADRLICKVQNIAGIKKNIPFKPQDQTFFQYYLWDLIPHQKVNPLTFS